MDNVILEAQDLVEVSSEPTERELRDLSDLHLALVGGGSGDISMS